MGRELELLDIWQSAAAAAPPLRGVALLAASDPALSAEELMRMPVGALDARLFVLRRDWFGDVMTGTAACAQCGATIELEVRASELAAAGTQSGTALPDVRDLMAVSSLDAASARRALAMRIADADALTDDEVDAVAAALDDVYVATACPECGAACEVVVDPAAFLYSEVAAAAGRVLRDVHVLAAAYGWTEEDVLALPPSRRRLYVEMVSG